MEQSIYPPSYSGPFSHGIRGRLAPVNKFKQAFLKSSLVWIVVFICLIVSTYGACLSEHRARLAMRLHLIEDVRLLRELWDKIQYDYKDSSLVNFPLSGFDVEKWDEPLLLDSCSITVPQEQVLVDGTRHVSQQLEPILLVRHD